MIRIRNKIFVDKNAVPPSPRHALQRQGNEIAEPAFRHIVLIGKQPVVCGKADAVPHLHRAVQKQCSEFPCIHRTHFIRKEKPHMPAKPGTGTLDEKRNLMFFAYRAHGYDIVFPTAAVEIHRQKIAMFIFGERINTNDVRSVRRFPLQMLIDRAVVERGELSVFAFRTLCPPLVAKPGIPLVQTDGLITAFAALFAVPPLCINIFPSAKQRTKKFNFFFRRALIRYKNDIT